MSRRRTGIGRLAGMLGALVVVGGTGLIGCGVAAATPIAPRCVNSGFGSGSYGFSTGSGGSGGFGCSGQPNPAFPTTSPMLGGICTSPGSTNAGMTCSGGTWQMGGVPMLGASCTGAAASGGMHCSGGTWQAGSSPMAGQSCSPADTGAGMYCSGGTWHAGAAPVAGASCTEFSGMPQYGSWGVLSCKSGTWTR